MKLKLALSLALLSALPLAAATKEPAAKHKTVYDYSLVGLDGKEVSLSTYKGKVLLIVNLASQSIYSSELAALEALQKAYSDKGLVVIGIPSGDFGAEELKDDASIKQFYLDKEKLTFPVYSKASLRGKDTIPLVKFLTDPKDGAAGGEIHWNYTKFLVDKEGKAVARYEADSDPADPEFKVTIEQLLDGTFKKKAGGEKDSAPPAGDDDDDGDGV